MLEETLSRRVRAFLAIVVVVRVVFVEVVVGVVVGVADSVAADAFLLRSRGGVVKVVHTRASECCDLEQPRSKQLLTDVNGLVGWERRSEGGGWLVGGRETTKGRVWRQSGVWSRE